MNSVAKMGPDPVEEVRTHLSDGEQEMVEPQSHPRQLLDWNLSIPQTIFAASEDQPRMDRKDPHSKADEVQRQQLS